MTKLIFELNREQILEYAEKYSSLYKPEPVITQHSYLTFAEFLQIAKWKTARQLTNYLQNEEIIEEVTKAAFSAKSERLKITALTALQGVDYPVASALLHVGHSENYPIIDFRAMKSLWGVTRKYYSFDCWWCYVRTCRALARKHNISVRQLDKALWAFSKISEFN